MVLPKRVSCAKCAKTVRSAKKLRSAGEKKFRNALKRYCISTNEDIPNPELPICNKCRDTVVRYCKAVLHLDWKDAVMSINRQEAPDIPQQHEQSGQDAGYDEDSVESTDEREGHLNEDNPDVQQQSTPIDQQQGQIQEPQTTKDKVPEQHSNHVVAGRLQTKRKCLTSSINSGVSKIFLPNIDTVRFSEGRCLVCKSRKGRHHIPISALEKLWVSEEIFVPATVRACPQHFHEGSFDEDSVARIADMKSEGAYLNASQIEGLMSSLRHQRTPALIDVDSPVLSNTDYQLLFGIGKEEFEDLFSHISGHLRDTTHRTARNCLGVFLAKMRLAVSQKVLSFMFGIGSQRKVSQIIARVSFLLEKEFVPKHLGFDHLTRQQAIANHGSKYISELYELQENVLVIYIDGTYIYVQKSSDHKLQKELHSQHKHRALIKTMMVVLPSGYILDAYGLYKANNNDAVIFEDMIDKGIIQSLLRKGDRVVCDRGFRDVKKKMDDVGLVTLMPSLLKKGQHQFTEEECNLTRKVTMTRWVVESANGRLKSFRFFDVVVPNHYYVRDSHKKLGRYLRICCALINKYFPPLFQDSTKHNTILDIVKNHVPQSESLQEEVLPYEKKRTMWKSATDETIPDFPVLTSEDLFRFTLGSYQARNAENYATQHVMSEGSFTILVHREKPGLLKARLASRFHSGQHHVLWIEYDNANILRYFCKCKVGTRSLGCCSHIATVIWYFGYRKHQLPSFCPKALGLDILDASDKLYKQSKKQLENLPVLLPLTVPGTDEDDIETDVSSTISSVCDVGNLSDFEEEKEYREEPFPTVYDTPIKRCKQDTVMSSQCQKVSVSRSEVDLLIKGFFESHR